MRISRSLSVLVLSLISLAGTLAAQTLSVGATSLTFSSALGGASQQQPLNVTSSGGSVTFAVFPNVSWLTATPSSGSTPSTVQVTVNPASLAAGYNTATLEIINVNTPSNTVYVTVTVVVSAVGTSPSALSFSYQLGSTLPATQTITLSGTATTYIASASANWLTVTSSGTVPGAVGVSLNSAAGGRHLQCHRHHYAGYRSGHSGCGHANRGCRSHRNGEHLLGRVRLPDQRGK
jgi:hypothetical protein